MALSNSERQTRYRTRLKEAALANSGGAVFIDPMRVFAGTLADAPSGSLMIPLSEYAAAIFLVFGEAEGKTAFSVGPDFAYHAFRCGDNTAHSGLIVSDVKILVDIASAYDRDDIGRLKGAVWRRGEAIGFHAIVKDGGFDTGRDMLWSGSAGDHSSSAVVAYSRWQVVIEEHDKKFALLQVDIGSE